MGYREKTFSREIKNSIEKQLQPCHYHKIPDAIFNPRGSFNPEKKYDAYVTYQGCFTAMEYKIHKNKNAFALSNLRLIQRASLLEAHRSGCNAYVVLGIRYEKIRKTYFIPIVQYVAEMEKRKSIPLSDLEQFPQLSWAGGGEWYLKKELFLYEPH